MPLYSAMGSPLVELVSVEKETGGETYGQATEMELVNLVRIVLHRSVYVHTVC